VSLNLALYNYRHHRCRNVTLTISKYHRQTNRQNKGMTRKISMYTTVMRGWLAINRPTKIWLMFGVQTKQQQQQQ